MLSMIVVTMTTVVIIECRLNFFLASREVPKIDMIFFDWGVVELTRILSVLLDVCRLHADMLDTNLFHANYLELSPSNCSLSILSSLSISSRCLYSNSDFKVYCIHVLVMSPLPFLFVLLFLASILRNLVKSVQI